MRIADPRSEVRPETAKRLAEQLEFVSALVAKDSSAQLLNSYLLGEHYFRLGRNDFAALLYYRTIEKSLAERLRRGYQGFDVSKPDYRLLDPDVDRLADRYGQQAMAVFKSNRPIALPWRVQLIEAVIILYLLGDEMLPLANVKGVGAVNHLRRLADIRNQSVLAHGETPVGADDCEKLQKQALVHIRAFWRLHEADHDVDKQIETLRFVTEA